MVTVIGPIILERVVSSRPAIKVRPQQTAMAGRRLASAGDGLHSDKRRPWVGMKLQLPRILPIRLAGLVLGSKSGAEDTYNSWSIAVIKRSDLWSTGEDISVLRRESDTLWYEWSGWL